MANKRPSYNPLPSSPAFSPGPDTPISTGGFYSPLNPSNIALPTSSNLNQRRKSKQQQQHPQPSNKRRKSSNLPNQSADILAGTSLGHHPNDHTHNQNKDDQGDADLDPEDEELRKELNDDDYSVRKREDLINKDKLKILLEHFDPQQMDRYTEYRNSGLAKANVRKLANTILQQSVSDRVTIVIRGLAKVFVGHIVEQALEIQKKRGGTGGLTQYDLKQAYRIHLNERDRGGSDRRKMFIR